MLKKLYLEQKSTNRNLQRIINIMLMMSLALVNTETKKQNNNAGKRYSQLRMILVIAVQGLLFAMDIKDIIDRKKQ